jgi:hypothetical protein
LVPHPEKLGAANEPRRLKVLDALRAVVGELLPEFGNLRIQEQPRLGFVVDKRGQPFYLHQLSDGERGLLALVFDLTRRLAIANPDSDNPISEGVALVLIDEIELHLHPKWQRDVLQRLRDIFKACQFVVTTHSPLVLGEVEARCVRFLEFVNGKVGVTVPTEAYGMDANRILQEFMGAPVRNRQVDGELKTLFELIDQERFDDGPCRDCGPRTQAGRGRARADPGQFADPLSGGRRVDADHPEGARSPPP